MNERIISALVGLAGAAGNNGKTEHTDTIVLKALLACFGPADINDILSEIKREKYTISPNCETCPTPCGNTSDYDMQKYHLKEDLKPLKTEMLQAASDLAARLQAAGKNELPDELYQALSFFSYELAPDSYQKLIQTLQQMEDSYDTTDHSH